MKCSFYSHPRDFSAKIAELETGEVIILSGWNGEVWTECWHTVSMAGYPSDPEEWPFECRPIYDVDRDDFDIIGIEII